MEVDINAPKKDRLHKEVGKYVKFLKEDILRLAPLEKITGEVPTDVQCHEGTLKDFKGSDIGVVFKSRGVASTQHKQRQNENSNHPRAGKDVGVEVGRGYAFYIGGRPICVMDQGRDMYQIPSHAVIIRRKNGEFLVDRPEGTEVNSELFVVRPNNADYHLWFKTEKVKMYAQKASDAFFELWEGHNGLRERLSSNAIYGGVTHVHPMVRQHVDKDWPVEIEIIAKQDRDRKEIVIKEEGKEDIKKRAYIVKAIAYIRPELFDDSDYVKIEGVPEI